MGTLKSNVLGLFTSFSPNYKNIYIYTHSGSPINVQDIMLFGVGWMSLQTTTLLKYIISYNPGYGLWK